MKNCRRPIPLNWVISHLWCIVAWINKLFSFSENTRHRVTFTNNTCVCHRAFLPARFCLNVCVLLFLRIHSLTINSGIEQRTFNSSLCIHKSSNALSDYYCRWGMPINERWNHQLFAQCNCTGIMQRQLNLVFCSKVNYRKAMRCLQLASNFL